MSATHIKKRESEYIVCIPLVFYVKKAYTSLGTSSELFYASYNIEMTGGRINVYANFKGDMM